VQGSEPVESPPGHASAPAITSVAHAPTEPVGSPTSMSRAMTCTPGTSRHRSEPCGRAHCSGAESHVGRIPQTTELNRDSSSNGASRRSYWSRAQLAYIQPGTVGSRLKSLCPVRSMYVSGGHLQTIAQRQSVETSAQPQSARPLRCGGSDYLPDHTIPRLVGRRSQPIPMH
jgi:hypothetical protein